jgi:uncharacterized membrane protein
LVIAHFERLGQQELLVAGGNHSFLLVIDSYSMDSRESRKSGESPARDARTSSVPRLASHGGGTPVSRAGTVANTFVASGELPV